MIISYLGTEFFKVQFGDIILSFNPVSKESSRSKGAKFGSDIVLVSLNHQDFNGIDNGSFGDRSPFVISGPGEYEVKGVFVKGFPVKTSYSGQEKINTVYSVVLEEMNICFLGPLGQRDIGNIEGDLGEIDVLFVPIGGDDVLDPAAGYKLAVKLEPKVIIPMHYDPLKDKEILKTFFKEAGEEKIEAVDKLTLKKKDLAGKEAEVVIISPSA